MIVDAAARVALVWMARASPCRWINLNLHASPAAPIQRLVRRRLGLHMSVHLWRHVMGAKLAERTDHVESAQRLLGHVPGSSTRSYIRLGTKLAARKLGDITDEARPHGVELLQRRGRAHGRPIADGSEPDLRQKRKATAL